MNNIKKYNFLIFFIICLGFLLAQTYNISGIVVDSDTKNPINNVNIYVENLKIGTVSDNNGLFLLNINYSSQNRIYLNVEMIGYEKQHIEIVLTKRKIYLGEILLKSKSLEIESINIHSHNHNNTSKVLLSGQKLNDNLKGSIAATLSNEPNIGVNSFGTVTSKPVIRGYSGDRFLLTKDGNKTGDLSQSSIDHIIALDMTDVNKIEIIRGPESLVYGSNSIGGVINASINGNPKFRVDKLFIKSQLGTETFNDGIYGNLSFYIPIQDYQFNMMVNNRKTDNQTSPIGTLDNTFSESSNYKLGLTKYSLNSYTNIIIENFNMDYGIPPSFEGHINGVDIELIKNSFQFNFHKDFSFLKFNQLDIKYNFIDYEHSEFEKNSDFFTVALAKDTHSFKTELKSSSIIFGSEFNYKKFSPQGFYWTPKTDELDLSIYGYNEFDLKNVEFLGSFRFGYLSIRPNQNNISFSNLDNSEIKEKNFQYFSSSFGLRKIIDEFEINSWVMSTMKAPKIEELYSDGPHLGVYSYEIGDPNLKLEKIYGFESSVNYLKDSMSAGLNIFYNYSPYFYQMSKMGECEEEFIIGQSHPCAGADFIEWGSGSSGWLYKYKTEGIKSAIKGLEFNFKYELKMFYFSYDFSLVRGDDLSNEIPLSYMNPDKQAVSFEYENDFINYKLRFVKIHSQSRIGEFESYTPSCLLTDFIFSFNRKNQNVTIQINNIFNQEYYNHLSRIKSIMPESGRNLIISYKIFI